MYKKSNLNNIYANKIQFSSFWRQYRALISTEMFYFLWKSIYVMIIVINWTLLKLIRCQIQILDEDKVYGLLKTFKIQTIFYRTLKQEFT